MSDSNTVAVFQDGDGILLFGSEAALAVVDSDASLVSRKLPSRSVGNAGKLLATTSEFQVQGGRWLKMTEESAGLVRKLGSSRSKVDGLMTGVVRRDKGKIVQHLRFENAGLLTPAAPAALGAIATQMALESALKEITEYLETIDAKLDRLLKQRKTEALGNIGGVALAIDEAHAIFGETGVVSATTWSKVQSNSTALSTMQAESIAQLAALAKEISDADQDTNRLAAATANAKADAPFWLGILAHTMVLENKQYILELARVADSEVDSLESHRQGILVARTERLRRIRESLAAIQKELERVGELSSLKKVTNPFKVGKIVDNTNVVHNAIASFALTVELEGIGAAELAKTPWSKAVKALVGEGTDWAAATHADVIGKAKALGQQIEDSRDEAILRRAERVREKRESQNEVEEAENHVDEPETDEV